MLWDGGGLGQQATLGLNVDKTHQGRPIRQQFPRWYGIISIFQHQIWEGIRIHVFYIWHIYATIGPIFLLFDKLENWNSSLWIFGGCWIAAHCVHNLDSDSDKYLAYFALQIGRNEYELKFCSFWGTIWRGHFFILATNSNWGRTIALRARGYVQRIALEPINCNMENGDILYSVGKILQTVMHI